MGSPRDSGSYRIAVVAERGKDIQDLRVLAVRASSSDSWDLVKSWTVRRKRRDGKR